MKKILSALVVAGAVAAAPSAQAQFAADLKVGYAVPTGNLVQTGTAEFSGSMSNVWSGAVPIEVAGRYRFTPNLSAGIYFQYNPAFVASYLCSSGLSCSGYDMRVGAEAVYGFLPDGTINPWVSVGTGWQWTQFKLSGFGQSISATFHGWEYFNVQVGADWNITKMFAFGPYIGFFGGTYTAASLTSEGQTQSGTINSSARSFHGWLQFGVKGTVNL